jgi:hypothetical protein
VEAGRTVRQFGVHLGARVAKDIADFHNVWSGGYYEGDPTDAFAASSYLGLGYVSVLYATYLVCIKPYVGPDTTVLEIGPGRGAWTKTFVDLGASKVWALDAASAEHSGFYDYVGLLPQVEHHQVSDQSLREVPDNSVDFFFSFGVFCHLPEPIIGDYLRALPSKMKPGAHGFFLVADFDQYDTRVRQPDAIERLFELRRFYPQRVVHRAMNRLAPLKYNKGSRWENPGTPPTGWYHLGKARASELAREAGLVVVEEDTGTCPRDPILHVVRP